MFALTDAREFVGKFLAYTKVVRETFRDLDITELIRIAEFFGAYVKTSVPESPTPTQIDIEYQYLIYIRNIMRKEQKIESLSLSYDQLLNVRKTQKEITRTCAQLIDKYYDLIVANYEKFEVRDFPLNWISALMHAPTVNLDKSLVNKFIRRLREIALSIKSESRDKLLPFVEQKVAATAMLPPIVAPQFSPHVDLPIDLSSLTRTATYDRKEVDKILADASAHLGKKLVVYKFKVTTSSIYTFPNIAAIPNKNDLYSKTITKQFIDAIGCYKWMQPYEFPKVTFVVDGTATTTSKYIVLYEFAEANDAQPPTLQFLVHTKFAKPFKLEQFFVDDIRDPHKISAPVALNTLALNNKLVNERTDIDSKPLVPNLEIDYDDPKFVQLLMPRILTNTPKVYFQNVCARVFASEKSQLTIQPIIDAYVEQFWKLYKDQFLAEVAMKFPSFTETNIETIVFVKVSLRKYSRKIQTTIEQYSNREHYNKVFTPKLQELLCEKIVEICFGGTNNIFIDILEKIYNQGY